MSDSIPTRPPLTFRLLWKMLKESGQEWLNDKVPRLGAALAFYSVLSIGPLLLIVIAIAGLAFGRDAVSGYLYEEIRDLVGDIGAQAIQAIIASSASKSSGIVATLIGLVTLIISATGFFAQLQDAMNAVWNVDENQKRHWSWFIRKRVLSFALIVGIGFLLLISLVISAALTALNAFVSDYTPVFMAQIINHAVSFIVTTFMFAMVFKILPDVRIRWRDVWVGAAITAILFSFGKYLIGLYLGQSALSSAYGAAGSLIVLLVWIYYSTQIFFFGAEFTQVYTRHFSTEITPRTHRSNISK
ncbi:YihY/virulence factor BrkB family protein [Asticcacaulis tiandongensis]|uniref:YihY/virulence factor BrkB family protein n=1 Tax=Asticcacaulis tiandongensis TaxID=2565365 RepID=UPI00112847B2|nr:YihY/virulence factor BrkB family protein [Asticcacaulis tiandongensis]